MMHAAHRMARVLALVLACVSQACGPVGTPVPESPVEATARRSVTAALRAALAELCAATLPRPHAHPMTYAAWGVACASHITPAVGVPLSPPPPPASPLEVAR